MRNPLRSVRVCAIAALLAACSSPAATPVATSTPATSAPATSVPATTTPTAAAQATPGATVEKTRQSLFVFPDPSGKMTSAYQVIAELKNDGPDMARLYPLGERLTIHRKDGSQVLTAQFTFVYPEFVAAGGFAYMIDRGTDPSPIADFAVLDVSPTGGIPFSRAVSAADATFAVGDIAWHDAPGGGLTATGNVTATAASMTKYAIVAVLCIGADGAIRGATTTHVPVANLAPNAKTAFTTDEPTSPVKASDCATSVGFASAFTPLAGGD